MTQLTIYLEMLEWIWLTEKLYDIHFKSLIQLVIAFVCLGDRHRQSLVQISLPKPGVLRFIYFKL